MLQTSSIPCLTMQHLVSNGSSTHRDLSVGVSVAMRSTIVLSPLRICLVTATVSSSAIYTCMIGYKGERFMGHKFVGWSKGTSIRMGEVCMRGEQVCTYMMVKVTGACPQ